MSSPLEGLLVVEASGPIGHYAGRLLADLGADVVKVEPPWGDPGRRYPPFLDGTESPETSLPFLLLNANKRSVSLDLRSERDRERFLELVGASDVLLDDWQDGGLEFALSDEILERINPTLIRASVTGWGLSGPRAQWSYADLVGCATSGVMRLAGFPEGPPEQLPDSQGDRCASIAAVAGILAALLHRDATGEGQRVEVSAQEALAMAQETAMLQADILYTDRGRTGGRAPSGIELPGFGLREASDGYVYLMASGTAGSGFAGLLALMADEGAVEDLLVEPYSTFIATSLNRVTLTALLADEERQAETSEMVAHVDDVVRRFVRSRPKRWLYEEGQKRRVLIGMVSTPQDVGASPQLEGRSWWTDVEDVARRRVLRYPGPPWQLRGTPASLRRPAPTLGQHNEELASLVGKRPPLATRTTERIASPDARPLDGVKVLDLSWFGAGPIATRGLASLGAEVIRLETSKRPDGLRAGQPRPPGSTSLNLSGYYNNYNADKQSFTVDLTTPEGHELGLRLVEWADMFVTNMTNRAVGKVGMDWETVSRANPGIVALYMPMQGLTGPHAEFQGFGSVLSAICGLNHLAGFEENEPIGVGTNYPDYVINPVHGMIALLAAWRVRLKTGAGQLIDMSQLESSVAAMAGPLFCEMNSDFMYRREGNRVLHAAPHGVFPVLGNDEWVAIACETELQWRSLAALCGHEEWIEDERFRSLADRKQNEDILEALICSWTSSQDGDRAVKALQRRGIPSGAVLRASEVLADPHLVARGYFTYLDHEEAGRRAYDGPPFRLSKTPPELRRAAPLLGEHTYDIAATVLHLQPNEVAELIATGVLV